MHPPMIKTSLLLITMLLGIDHTVSSPVQTQIRERQPQLVPNPFEDPGPVIIDASPFVPIPSPFVPIPIIPASVFPPVVTTAPSKIVARSSDPSDPETPDSVAATITNRPQATNAAAVNTEETEPVNKPFAWEIPEWSPPSGRHPPIPSHLLRYAADNLRDETPINLAPNGMKIVICEIKTRWQCFFTTDGMHCAVIQTSEEKDWTFSGNCWVEVTDIQRQPEVSQNQH